ncbi:hypothetical protein [Streptomyces sp. MBT33]|uniref:hypothetical protein n=1 Tax=Streptomyces sp. MBT33 TaxID=1488363 RepID=UPI00190BDCF4|nr:hypothetical protein [Streptomyces sp. MBT33]MBK3645692.1 hypothetical protein [Streptomyces sp. MBT33]
MTYQHPDLNLTDPTKGFAHFVLYTEPRIGAVGAAWNATVSIERPTPYVEEWVGRLERCEPNALHTTLVDPQEIPRLFHPCVDEDKASPSAVSGDGCTCRRTWVDPEFGLPVVGEHFRTVGGSSDRWTYTTYAPLDLRPDDAVESVIVDRGGLFWARTTEGVLSVLPMLESSGYGAGPTAGAGGASAFAGYLQQLLDTSGHDAAARGRASERHDPRILAWVRSDAARRAELTMTDLELLLQPI